MKIISPANEKLIAEIPEDTLQSIEKKYQTLRSYQKEWAKTSYEIKKAAIQKFCTLLEIESSKLAQDLSQEMGKPISQARDEVLSVHKRILYFIERCEKLLKPDKVFQNPEQTQWELISHDPLGVIANISAWNYPYYVGCNVIIPALLMGNTVLYKPSEFATLTGLNIVRLLYRAGIPESAIQAVVGTGIIGQALLDQPINGVFFTGSYATGKKIAEKVAGRMIKVQLELGGKDPAYVCEDAQLSQAIDSLVSGVMYNSGQSCCSVERIYVHEKIYKEFLDQFVIAAKNFTVGPLARKEQVQVLKNQVADAQEKGGRLLMGGQTSPEKSSYYFEPTIVADATNEMKIIREESFGPIIGIQKVKDDQEAIRLMNDNEYGLTAAIYSTNLERSQALMAQLDAGTVYWNQSDRVSPYLPWTGRKNSGIGSTLSEIGILNLTQPKAWHFKKV